MPLQAARFPFHVRSSHPNGRLPNPVPEHGSSFSPSPMRRMRTASYIDSIPQNAMLDVVERAPAEGREAQRGLESGRPTGTPGTRSLGLLDVVRLVRTDQLGRAIDRFWTIDETLNTATSAALNRYLVYQLSDSGRVQDAGSFLMRWRAPWDDEIKGTPRSRSRPVSQHPWHRRCPCRGERARRHLSTALRWTRGCLDS